MNSVCGVLFVFYLAELCYLAYAKQVTWCVYEPSQLRKCLDLSHDFASVGYLPILCQEELDPLDCLELVRSSSQSIMTLDAGHLYHSQRISDNIKVVLAEYNGLGEMWSNLVRYYSVALVKAGDRNLELLELEDKRVCHGVYDEESSSGWDIPLGLLSYHRELLESSRCNIIERINGYFGESCLPTPSGQLNRYMRTCEACSSGSCSSEVEYRGDSGGLRCLVEGAGDVAFLRHDTVLKYLDDRSDEDWAVGLQNRDFRLLCPDGSQTTIDNYEWCYTGIMMSNTLIVSGNMSDEMVTKFQNQIRNPPPEAQKYMFNNLPYSVTSDNVIFSNNTVELVPIRGFLQNPRNFLDQYKDRWNPSYQQAMDSLYCSAPLVHCLNLELLVVVLINCLFRTEII